MSPERIRRAVRKAAAFPPVYRRDMRAYFAVPVVEAYVIENGVERALDLRTPSDRQILARSRKSA